MTTYATVVLALNDRLTASVEADMNITDRSRGLRAFMSDLKSIMLGVRRGHSRLVVASVVASQTVTCDQSQAVSNTDNLVIGGTTITAETSPSGTAQFAIGSSTAAYMANIVACINANPTLAKIVFAKVTSSTQVTIYCKYPGPIGNLVTLTKTGNSFTLGGTSLANGASDAPYEQEYGYTPY